MAIVYKTMDTKAYSAMKSSSSSRAASSSSKYPVTYLWHRPFPKTLALILLVAADPSLVVPEHFQNLNPLSYPTATTRHHLYQYTQMRTSDRSMTTQYPVFLLWCSVLSILCCSCWMYLLENCCCYKDRSCFG